jgi:phage N-6-adenine-methyltransferase
MRTFMNKVFCGDARKLLSQMPTASVDAVITDAMYGTSKCCRYDWGVDPARGDPEKHWFYHRPIYEECLRVLKPGGALAWAQGAKFCEHFPGWFGGYRVWTLTRFRRKGMNATGHVWIVQTREQKPIDFPDRDSLAVFQEMGSLIHLHPCIKPPEEIAFMIESLTKPGDVVLDCFCGLGSTLVAAQDLNRNWVACDISRFYCQVTMARLKGTSPVELDNISDSRLSQDGEGSKKACAEPTPIPAKQGQAHSKNAPVEPPTKMDGTAAPEWLFDVLNEQVRALTGRGFELDTAASRWNAKCPDYYDEEIDALSRDWSDWDSLYCNPPFSAKLMERFAEKALSAATSGTTVVMLLPLWPGYLWFQELVRHGHVQYVIGPIVFKRDTGKAVIRTNGRFSDSIVVITLGPHVRPGTTGVPIRKPSPPRRDRGFPHVAATISTALGSGAPVDGDNEAD